MNNFAFQANKTLAVYGLLAVIIAGTIGYSFGYSARHNAVYVKYSNIATNGFIEGMEAVGVAVSPQQALNAAEYFKGRH